jgi:hypothetical protein
MSYIKNKAGQKIGLIANNLTTGLPQTGDAANITAKISKDFGVAASVSDTNPTELDAVNFPGVYVFDLTQSETNADVLTIKATSTTANVSLEIKTIETADLTDTENAVWDAAYASHTTAGTFGKLMDLLRKANRAIEGEVSGTPTTTAFDTNLTGYTTGAFDSEVLVFVSGSLNGEARPILSFSATNGRLTFEEPWTAAPTASDEFVILPYHVHAVSEIASGIWSESQSSYTTAGTFGNYLDAKVSEAGGGYIDGPIVGRVIQDGTTEATVTEGEVIKGIVLD